jgi:hypothetical protein
MANNTWVNLLDPHVAVRGTAKNTFTAYQDVYGVLNHPDSLPTSYANELKLGTRVRLTAIGEFSTTGTPTLGMGFIYGATPAAAGGVAIAQSVSVTTGSGAAAWPWEMRYYGVVTSTGGPSALGVLYGSGIWHMGTGLDAYTEHALPNTAAARSASIDTTVQKQWGVGVVWGTSSISNSVTVDVFTVEILNQGKT